jgi:hypothetical protein
MMVHGLPALRKPPCSPLCSCGCTQHKNYPTPRSSLLPKQPLWTRRPLTTPAFQSSQQHLEAKPAKAVMLLRRRATTTARSRGAPGRRPCWLLPGRARRACGQADVAGLACDAFLLTVGCARTIRGTPSNPTNRRAYFPGAPENPVAGGKSAWTFVSIWGRAVFEKIHPIMLQGAAAAEFVNEPCEACTHISPLRADAQPAHNRGAKLFGQTLNPAHPAAPAVRF